jgi:hypothetical protein
MNIPWIIIIAGIVVGVWWWKFKKSNTDDIAPQKPLTPAQVKTMQHNAPFEGVGAMGGYPGIGIGASILKKFF